MQNYDKIIFITNITYPRGIGDNLKFFTEMVGCHLSKTRWDTFAAQSHKIVDMTLIHYRPICRISVCDFEQIDICMSLQAT